MSDIKLYVETLSNKFATSCDDDYPVERDEYDAGYVEGWEHACSSILKQIEQTEVKQTISAETIYECLKTIRYDKNASGAFSSAQLKDEFTDYALRDIAIKLFLSLGGQTNVEK